MELTITLRIFSPHRPLVSPFTCLTYAKVTEQRTTRATLKQHTFLFIAAPGRRRLYREPCHHKPLSYGAIKVTLLIHSVSQRY